MAAKESKAQKAIPIIIDGFEINGQNVTYQKLQEFSLILYEKLLKHRNERNFLLLERDKVRTILENIRYEIKVANDTGLNKDEELERDQERHRREMKEVEEEVKFILFDHNTNLSDLKLWEINLLEKIREKNLAEELELWQEKRQLKEKLAAEKLNNEEELKRIKNQHHQEIIEVKKKQDEVQMECEIEFRRSLNNTVEQLTLKHEMEMSEVEERKNTHLAGLKKIHKTRFKEIKDFYNSITADHLNVISNMKKSLDEMKKNKCVMLHEQKLLKEENKKFIDPLLKLKVEVKNLRSQVINYEKDLLSLKNNKYMLSKKMEATKKIKNQSTLTVEKINANKNYEYKSNLGASCPQDLSDFLIQATHKINRLEKLIERLVRDLNNKNKIIAKLTSDPDIQQALKELNFEYWDTKKLSYELAVISKSYNELLQTFQEKLKEFCVPESELGFELIKLQGSGSNSASLVSKQ